MMHHIMMTYGEVEVQLQLFLVAVLCGRYRSALRPGHFAQRNIPGYHDAGGWVGHVAGLYARHKGKISAPFGNPNLIHGVHAAA
jgi:hypothetical protein